jgi:hypothetical protein
VVFVLFDGEGFILQAQRVFTRIRSRAAAAATGGSARGSTISGTVAVCTGGGLLARSVSNGCKCGGGGVKNPKGFSFYLSVNRWLCNGWTGMFQNC